MAARGVMSGEGPRPPGMAEPPQASAEQLAVLQRIDGEINFELNVLNMCYGATHNFVSTWQRSQPPDSAEIGEAMFGAGKRTPIELAEPEMALEVYRQVRANMRANESQAQAGPKDALSVIGEGLNAALVALAGRKP